MQKAQEAKGKTDGSATTGATRPHERPATASKATPQTGDTTQAKARPVTASSASASVKTAEPKQTVQRQNVPKVEKTSVSRPQEVRQTVRKEVTETNRQTKTSQKKSVQKTSATPKRKGRKA